MKQVDKRSPAPKQRNIDKINSTRPRCRIPLFPSLRHFSNFPWTLRGSNPAKSLITASNTAEHILSTSSIIMLTATPSKLKSIYLSNGIQVENNWLLFGSYTFQYLIWHQRDLTRKFLTFDKNSLKRRIQNHHDNVFASRYAFPVRRLGTSLAGN